MTEPTVTIKITAQTAVELIAYVEGLRRSLDDAVDDEAARERLEARFREAALALAGGLRSIGYKPNPVDAGDWIRVGPGRRR